MQCAYYLSQVSMAPLGTQACTLDIEKFHQTCPVLPSHKPWLIAQGAQGDFYIDHSHPFGALCVSSNSGQIANAALDIWLAKGVDSVLKYEDDLNLFHCPSPNSAFHNNNFSYNYDYNTALSMIQPLGIPWHRKKGTQIFHMSPPSLVLNGTSKTTQ